MSDERRDELLRRLVTGEDVPEAERAALRGDAELAELEALMAELDREGARERERIVAAAQARGSAPGEERAAQVLAGAARRRAPRWLAAAAAVLLAALGTAWFSGLGRPSLPDNVMLSPAGALSGLAIEGDTVRWELRDAQGRERYELEFWDAGDQRPLHRVRGLAQTTWTIPTEQLETWPRRVLWEVRAYSSLGDELGSARAESRLSR